MLRASRRGDGTDLSSAALMPLISVFDMAYYAQRLYHVQQLNSCDPISAPKMYPSLGSKETCTSSLSVATAVDPGREVRKLNVQAAISSAPWFNLFVPPSHPVYSRDIHLPETSRVTTSVLSSV